MIFLALALAAASEPNSGVSFKLESGDLTQLPYIEAYVSCFEHAAVETKASSRDEQLMRYERCRTSHAELITKYNAEMPSHGLQAKRGFERNLNVIEKAYGEAINKQRKQD